ncbi:MAG: hypothetical protein QOH46_1917 [Solirubrobacteraceae bacterium]|nr:hypothetical protein [Solirubrobacteraceae bacterium]
MIRLAVAEDAAAIAHVHRSSRAEAYAHMGSNRVITTEEWDEWLPRSVTRVWDDRGALTGFGSVTDGLLTGLYVLPGVQGTGVGSALLAAAVADGARELWVYEERTQSRAFYERHGWVAEPESRVTGEDWRPRAPALRYRLA